MPGDRSTKQVGDDFRPERSTTPEQDMIADDRGEHTVRSLGGDVSRRLAIIDKAYVDFQGGKFVVWTYTDGQTIYLKDTYDADEVERWASSRGYELVYTQEAKDRVAPTHPFQGEDIHLGSVRRAAYGSDYIPMESAMEPTGYAPYAEEVTTGPDEQRTMPSNDHSMVDRHEDRRMGNRQRVSRRQTADVITDARQLSSGTMATLTGHDDYETTDAIRWAFTQWVTVNPYFETWQRAWNEWWPEGWTVGGVEPDMAGQMYNEMGNRAARRLVAMDQDRAWEYAQERSDADGSDWLVLRAKDEPSTYGCTQGWSDIDPGWEIVDRISPKSAGHVNKNPVDQLDMEGMPDPALENERELPMMEEQTPQIANPERLQNLQQGAALKPRDRVQLPDGSYGYFMADYGDGYGLAKMDGEDDERMVPLKDMQVVSSRTASNDAPCPACGESNRPEEVGTDDQGPYAVYHCRCGEGWSGSANPNIVDRRQEGEEEDTERRRRHSSVTAENFDFGEERDLPENREPGQADSLQLGEPPGGSTGFEDLGDSWAPGDRNIDGTNASQFYGKRQAAFYPGQMVRPVGDDSVRGMVEEVIGDEPSLEGRTVLVNWGNGHKSYEYDNEIEATTDEWMNRYKSEGTTGSRDWFGEAMAESRTAGRARKTFNTRVGSRTALTQESVLRSIQRYRGVLPIEVIAQFEVMTRYYDPDHVMQVFQERLPSLRMLR